MSRRRRCSARWTTRSVWCGVRVAVRSTRVRATVVRGRPSTVVRSSGRQPASMDSDRRRRWAAARVLTSNFAGEGSRSQTTAALLMAERRTAGATTRQHRRPAPAERRQLRSARPHRRPDGPAPAGPARTRCRIAPSPNPDLEQLRHRHHATLSRRHPSDREIGGCVQKPFRLSAVSRHTPRNSPAHGSHPGRKRHFLHSSMQKLTQTPRAMAVVSAARAPGSASIAANAKSANIPARARSLTS